MSDIDDIRHLVEASKKMLQASLRFDWEVDSEFDIATKNLSILVDEIEEDHERRFFKGDKVVFIGISDDQIKWGASSDDPRLVCIENTTYEIEVVEVHSWHTKLKLKYVEGCFNSVAFEKVK